MRYKYREIDGMPTTWKGKHATWYQRLIYKFYMNYVNTPFMPKGAEFHIKKDSVRISRYKGYNTADTESYYFNQFNKIHIE